MTAHGVLRLAGERAEKKRAHWEAIAIAACEQCGRNRVPQIHPVRSYADWLGDARTDDDVQRIVLSLVPGTQPLVERPAASAWQVLSGPEGGLSADEEARALAQRFQPARLGPRVLRAETAALAALTLLGGA
jgi:16S rRNA (uracil1498-N3)-methyltransferase